MGLEGVSPALWRLTRGVSLAPGNKTRFQLLPATRGKRAGTLIMSAQEPPRLGTCPSCETAIATFDVLIEYEDSNGQPQVWADCSGCGEVVHPE